MTSISIREYENTPATSQGLPVGAEPALVVQKTSTLPFTSEPFNVRTNLIRVVTDVPLSFVLGPETEKLVVDVSAADINAGDTVFFGVDQSAGHRIMLAAPVTGA